MKEVIEFKEEKFSSEQVLNALKALNIENQVDQEGIKLMQYGQPSPIFKNMVLNDGTVKDGKVTLVNDGDTPRISFQFKKQNLELPNKIFGHKLEKDDIQNLKDGLTIPIAKTDFFIKIDKDLNAVTVKTSKDIGIPKSLGGYELTKEDKMELANTSKISARVYKVPGKEEYFTGNLKLTDKGITISNINVISKEEAKDLMQELNNPKARTMANVVDTIKEGLMTSEKEVHKGEAVEYSSEVIKDAIEKTNKISLDNVVELAKNGSLNKKEVQEFMKGESEFIRYISFDTINQEASSEKDIQKKLNDNLLEKFKSVKEELKSVDFSKNGTLNKEQVQEVKQLKSEPLIKESIQLERESKLKDEISSTKDQINKIGSSSSNEQLARSIEQKAEIGLISDSSAKDSIMAIYSKEALSGELDKAIKTQNISKIAFIGQHQLGDGINFDAKISKGLDKEVVKDVYMKMNDLVKGEDKNTPGEFKKPTLDHSKEKNADLSL